MASDYQDKNIEFANRILNHRDELSQQEVTEWLASGENRKLLDELAGIKHTFEKREYHHFQSLDWQRIKKKIDKRQSYNRFHWLAVAAMLACTIGLGMWFWLRTPEMQMASQQLMTEIRPGTSRAELILAGGESIALQGINTQIETNSITGIVNDSTEGLNFSRAAVLDGQLKTEYNTLRVPVGGFYKLELSDGSKVWLNAASELKFPVRFTGNKREVYLSGEGYFEVAHDAEHQFVVHLKKSAVTVLGTKFNISAYEEEENIYTTLEEGAVSFYSELNKQQVTLQPGMQSAMNNITGLTELSEVDPSVYTSWVNGSFVFHSLRLETIMRQLQRWYDFEIFYQNPEVKEYTFRGVVNRDMNIERVLTMIERAMDVHFRIERKTIVVSK